MNKIIKVIWKDAQTINRTESLEELKEEKLKESISIGYLIEETDDKIILCSFIFPDDDADYNNINPEFKEFTGYRDAIIIPKLQIIKMVELIEK